MALIVFGLLNDDQYSNGDIYYPDWNGIKHKLIDNRDNNLDFNEITKDQSILLVKNNKKESSGDEESDLEGDELDVI